MSNILPPGSCLSYCFLPQGNDTIQKYAQALAASTCAVAIGALAATGILPSIPSVLPEVYVAGSTFVTYGLANIVMNVAHDTFCNNSYRKGALLRSRDTFRQSERSPSAASFSSSIAPPAMDSSKVMAPGTSHSAEIPAQDPSKTRKETISTNLIPPEHTENKRTSENLQNKNPGSANDSITNIPVFSAANSQKNSLKTGDSNNASADSAHSDLVHRKEIISTIPKQPESNRPPDNSQNNNPNSANASITTTQAFSTTDLTVVPMTDNFTHIAAAWQSAAKELARRPNLSKESRRTFQNCSLICEMIDTTIRRKDTPYDGYICIGKDNNAEGAMIVIEEENDLYMQDLVTNPKNLWDNPHKVSGVGKTLVQFAENRAIELNKERVTLIPLEEVVSFYEHLNFSHEKIDSRLSKMMFKCVHKNSQTSAA